MKIFVGFYRLFIALFILIAFASTVSAGEYIENWGDLQKCGLLPPETSDMKSAKKLIIMAIQATATFKGDWWTAHGMLGATRIPQHPEDALYAYLGYLSLFRSAITSAGHTKMEAIAEGFHSGSLVVGLNIQKASSWVFMREQYLGRLGWELGNRFQYNEDGNYGLILTPTPKHKTSLEMKETVEQACVFYDDMRKKGFDDKTLGDAIGIANAVLEYDGIKIDSTIIYGLPHANQIYKDVLTDIIKDIQKGASLYYALATQMDFRGLQKNDIIAMPESQEQMDAIVRLMKEDLNNIEKIVSSSPKKSDNKTNLNDSVQQKIKKTIEVWTKQEKK